ncbi:MAG: alpha-L-fucosidase [Kiritimatiellae bacterium]|nr:alpha-L-fucosidase [Kiritimatiellia bacterium]
MVETYAQHAAPLALDWGPLKNRRPAPDWFRDAKFGIYFHWGLYSVPAFGNEWYPRWMHFKGQRIHQHHVETYGDPSVFGYHDFAPMFEAKQFDADDWADLFRRAGARFAGPAAEHHDGFSMWASQVNPWNARDMGPKRDITGELAVAIRKRGMRFITTFHHARNLQRHDTPGKPYPHPGHYRDSHYPPVQGWPTTSSDPKLRLLYGNIPEDEFLVKWQEKLREVIDNYEPDMIWFDGWLHRIPEQQRLDFATTYLTRARDWGKEVMVVSKNAEFPSEIGLLDLEKGRMNELTDYEWLTDDTISRGSWCYTQDLEIKPAREVLHVLIDIVSKNGQLLLNLSPMADGTIPDNQRQVLLGIGDWLAKHGPAVYDTRPWLVYGEGPTRLEKGGSFTHKHSGYLQYTPDDIRFTRSPDGSTVYAIVLGRPGANQAVRITSFGNAVTNGTVRVRDVTLFSHDGKIEWSQTEDGLTLTTPPSVPDEMAVVFKINLR